METRLRSATLILAIHGSTEDSRPANLGNSLADSIRSKRLFADVKAAYHKHPPFLFDTLEQTDGDLVIIIPMLMSRGYFAEKVFPEALQLQPSNHTNSPLAHTYKDKTVIYGDPIGIHPGMEMLIVDSANRVLSQHPFPFKVTLQKTSIALVGHGTSRHSKSRESVDKLAANLNSAQKHCQSARTFFIEEEPSIEKIYDWTIPTKNVVVVPFMIADGPHAAQDIPLALGLSKKDLEQSLEQGTTTWRNPTERRGKRIWISSPVGLSPLLPGLILDYISNEISKVLMD